MGDLGDIVVMVFIVLVGVLSTLGKVLSDYLARKRAEEALARGEPASSKPRRAVPAGKPPSGPEREQETAPRRPGRNVFPPAPAEEPPQPEAAEKPAPRRVRRAPPPALGDPERPIGRIPEASRERADPARQEPLVPSLATFRAALPSQLPSAAAQPSSLSPASAPAAALRRPALSPSELRRAVILAEILGPPMALRDPFGRI